VLDWVANCGYVDAGIASGDGDAMRCDAMQCNAVWCNERRMDIMNVVEEKAKRRWVSEWCDSLSTTRARPDKVIATAKSGSFPLHTEGPLAIARLLKHKIDRAGQIKMAAGVKMSCEKVRRGVNAKNRGCEMV
jgi:hypothetical protein